MVSSRLTPLQDQLARALFLRSDTQVVLTGGAALAGFFLGHRTTKDLDFFGRSDVDLRAEEAWLQAAAASIGASVEHLRSLPYLHQLAVRRGSEVTVVDLVRDTAPWADAPIMLDGVRLHTPREIAANKLVALLGRAEPRDLVDLRALLALGLGLDQVIDDAASKDGGADPGTLAWLLSEWTIGSEAVLPGGVSPAELDEFRGWLEAELRRRAVPRT